MALKDFFQSSKFEYSGKQFNTPNDAALEVLVDGDIQIKMGSMVAMKGDISFKKRSSLSGGIGNFIKSKLSGEGGNLSVAKGSGMMLLADQGKKVIVLELENESLSVNGNDILAFENTLKHDIKMNKGMGSMLGAGLFNVIVSGTGKLAITCHKKAMCIEVKAGEKVITDPNATVAWSTSLNPKMKTDIGIKNLFGRGGGEGFQYEWSGDGVVIVQPYEEVYILED